MPPPTSNKPDDGAPIRVGRQAIFDRNMRLYAYELLYRGDDLDLSNTHDGTRATSTTLLNALLEVGVNRLAGTYRVFVNMTRHFVTDMPPLPIDKDRVVLELLEDIVVDAPLIAAVRSLHQQGYRLAIDDYTHEPQWAPLLPFVDIVKLEINADTMPRIGEVVADLRAHDLAILAEKIETQEQYQRLHELGVDYFQGYFFCRPSVVTEKRLVENRTTLIRLLSRLNDPTVEMAEISRLIGEDPALSFKVLRFINSAAIATTRQIESIQQAVVLLGLTHMRTWASLLALSGIKGKPLELINMGLLRAGICERIARSSGKGAPDTAYIVGLLSLLDALLDTPMTKLLDDIPLPVAVVDALCHASGLYGQMLSTARDLELDPTVDHSCCGLAGDTLYEIYLESAQAALATLKEISPG